MLCIAKRQLPDCGSKDARPAHLYSAKSERMVGIDLGRFIACLAVIFIHQQSIHYGPYHNTREVLNLASRWAVPFFFIISGYFMPTGTGWVNVALKYFLRLLPIFIFWTTVYAAIFGNPFWFFSEI